jgi:hypothetical protein
MSLFKIGLASAAFALTLSVAPDARAEFQGVVIAAVILTPLGHLTQTPAYSSIIYYAVENQKPMPMAWTVMNIGSSLLGGSAGLLTMSVAFGDRVPDNLKTAAGLAGFSLVTGSVVAITASLLQTARPKTTSEREDPVARSLVVLPTGGITPSGGATAGLSIAGRF